MNWLRRLFRRRPELLRNGEQPCKPRPAPANPLRPAFEAQWGTDHCQKCGQRFGGWHQEPRWAGNGYLPGLRNPEPAPRYANDPEHGERLLWTCPRCGYRWPTPVLVRNA